MSEIVPFGKYKGQPVEVLSQDKKYVDWLLAQEFFRNRYQNLYAIVINNGQQPTETPEHNAIQARFLDENYRLKFALAAHGPGILAYQTRTFEQRLEKWKADAQKRIDSIIANNSYVARLGKLVRDFVSKHEFRTLGGQGDSLMSLPPPVFEERGIDVFYRLSYGAYLRVTWQHIFEGRDNPPNDCDYFVQPSFTIEIKPTVGDDYPAILRQMKQSKAQFLLLSAYTGVGASKEQFVQLFESQGFKVVFEKQVNDAQLPALERQFTKPNFEL